MSAVPLDAHATWLLDLVGRCGFPRVRVLLPGRNRPVDIAATAAAWEAFCSGATEADLEAAWRGLEEWETALRLEVAQEGPRAS